MKKIILIFISAIIACLMCACGTMDIVCSIDEYNNAKMKLIIEIDLKDMDEIEIDAVEYTMYELEEYWQEKDFEVISDTINDTYRCSLEKTSKGKDFEDAVYELLELMGDDASPFMSVEGGYSEGYFSNIYNISAKLNFSNILDYEYIETLPKEQKDVVKLFTDNFKVNVIFDLPGDITENNFDTEGELLIKSIDTSITDEVSCVVEFVNQKNQSEYDELKNQIAEQEKQKQINLMLFLIMMTVAALLAAGLILTFIFRKKSLKKNLSDKASAQLPDSAEQTESKENENTTTPGEAEAEAKRAEDSQPAQTQTETKENEKQ